MSSTEAELNALADCAIELIVFVGVAKSLGLEIDGRIEVGFYQEDESVGEGIGSGEGCC